MTASSALPVTVPISAPPVTPTSPAVPEAIYRNPKIGMVYLRAHQDANGRLLGPQVMYQIVDPGSWNIDAIEEGHGYIPAVNLELSPNQGSPSIVPAKGIPPLASSSPLLDPVAAAEIIITGLTRLDDKPEADRLAHQQELGSTAVYDEQAGWLLLPPQKVP
jgi:hypothetical protein